MKRRNLKIIIMVLLYIFISGNGFSGVTEIDGTGFENSIEVQRNRLYLKGVAMLRYLIFVKAYTGAFYLPKESDESQALDDIMKYLELEYRVAISADDFAKATHQKIKESVSDSTYIRLYPKIESLNKLYRSVRPGDRYALAYIPGEGTQLIYNSNSLGKIEGADFANALFGIWIGNNPIDKEFRDKLLGKKK